jgi:DNA helicase-2/ATP-dependent DNA helicase PcrA
MEETLVRELGTLAFSLKNRGISIDSFEREALERAGELPALPFGQLFKPGKNLDKNGLPKKTACEPKTARTPEQLAAEAEREEKNVRAVGALFRRFDALLADEALLTYGDLLTRAIEMIRTYPSIAARIRGRWRHALVDEFQDTNPQQLAFIRAIFGDDLRSVMAVGDVRQAIYEWNGADPLGIVKLAERPGTTIFPLTLNRRSYQDILDTAHAVLPRAGVASTDVPLVSHTGAAPHHAVRHALFSGPRTVAACRELEARAIAVEIAGLEAGGVRRKEIAILLRSRLAARTYANALRDVGISSRTHGGVGFFDAPEIVDTVAWFRLLVDADDRRALARVLQSPAVGLSDGSVAKLFAGRSDVSALMTGTLPDWLLPEERHRLDRLRATLGIVGRSLGAPVTDAVRTTIRETAVDAARIAIDPSGAAQIQANVAKLVALAQGFAGDRPLARLADFVAEIDERAELEDDESEAELGGNEIAIMTIHGAKGLEWEHVFVANVSPTSFPSPERARETSVALAPNGALAFNNGVDGKKPIRWLLRKPHDAATGARLEKDADDKAEERRLFYVAITRAKESVWISGVTTRKDGTGSDFFQRLLDYVAGRAGCLAFPIVSLDPPTASAPAAGAGEPKRSDRTPIGTLDVDRLQKRLVRQPTLFERWRGKLSYTAISTFATCPRLARYRYVLRVPDFREIPDVDAFDDDDGTAIDARKIDAATYGTIVHGALEIVANDAIAGRARAIESAVDSALVGAERDGDTDVRRRAVAAVHRSLDALARFSPIAAEEEFDVTIGGANVGGFIDLITRDADGGVWIVDYKTGQAPDSAYALQLALYRIAVRATYPDARLAILRITDDDATLVEPPTPATADVERIVAEAAPLDRDDPRPGIHCETCPYAGALCPEGATEVARRLAIA